MSSSDKSNNHNRKPKNLRELWRLLVKWYNKTRIRRITLNTVVGIIAIAAFFGIKDYSDLQKKWQKINPFHEKNLTNEPIFSKASNFNILLFPFESLRDDKKRNINFERTIQIRLTEMSEQENLAISVVLDTIHSQPTGNSDARKIGRETGADLVIWGTSFKSGNISDEATLKYVLVDETPYRLNESGKSPTKQIASPKEITEGRLQKDIDYIIYWTFGLEAFTQNNCVQADYYFNNIFTKFPNKALDSYLKLAFCFTKNRNLDSADSIYTKVINQGIENERIYEAYFNRANIRMELGEYSKALSDINVAIYNSYRDSLAYFSRGLIKSRLNDTTALYDFDTAIHLGLNSEFAYFHRGKAKKERGDFDGALTDYNTSIKLNRTIAFFYNHRASVKVSMNDLDGALKDVNIALGLNPYDAFTFVVWGVIETRKANLTLALDYFNRAIAIDSTNVLAYLYRGSFKEKYTTDFDGAVEDLEKVMQLDSSYVGIRADIKRIEEKGRAFHFQK